MIEYKELESLLENLSIQDEIIKIVISGQIDKKSEVTKVVITPFKTNQILTYQFAYYTQNKVKHLNIKKDDFVNKVIAEIKGNYKQVLINTLDQDYQVFINKQDLQILKKSPSKCEIDLSHNRQKNYILKEGDPISFFVELGVMNYEGKVLKNKYNKFRQINRYLEFIQDVIQYLNKDKKIRIVDFGCGKSYLTFATYYYLHDMLKYDIEIIGLDLKKDVIDFCNKIAKNSKMENLKFMVGNIEEYDSKDDIDMVITLHACDTATDAALAKAVEWNSKVILSVPCCQHELNYQIKSEHLLPMLSQGIIKEKLSSLITDQVRLEILEVVGYKTQILEFIDTEHTPKNLLIRAIKSPNNDKIKHYDNYMVLKKEFGFELSIEKFLKKQIEEFKKAV